MDEGIDCEGQQRRRGVAAGGGEKGHRRNEADDVEKNVGKNGERKEKLFVAKTRNERNEDERRPVEQSVDDGTRGRDEGEEEEEVEFVRPRGDVELQGELGKGLEHDLGRPVVDRGEFRPFRPNLVALPREPGGAEEIDDRAEVEDGSDEVDPPPMVADLLPAVERENQEENPVQNEEAGRQAAPPPIAGAEVSDGERNVGTDVEFVSDYPHQNQRNLDLFRFQ